MVWPELDSSPAQHCHPHLCSVLGDSDSPAHSLDILMVSLALKISYASKTEGFIGGCAALEVWDRARSAFVLQSMHAKPWCPSSEGQRLCSLPSIPVLAGQSDPNPAHSVPHVTGNAPGAPETKFARGRSCTLHPKSAWVADNSDYMSGIFYKMILKLISASFVQHSWTHHTDLPNTLILFGSHLQKNLAYSLTLCSIINPFSNYLGTHKRELAS